jgi:hypothetical protein
MKFAQFLFRFLCLAVAIFQFGILINKAILENDNLEVNEIELSDSDESDTENQEEEMTFLGFSSRPILMYQDLDITSNSKKIKIYSPCRKLISETQSVPYSPPELKV